MASGFFVLSRFFLRVDGVLVRLNESRFYHQVSSVYRCALGLGVCMCVCVCVCVCMCVCVCFVNGQLLFLTLCVCACVGVGVGVGMHGYVHVCVMLKSIPMNLVLVCRIDRINFLLCYALVHYCEPVLKTDLLSGLLIPTYRS